ncbi:MAG: patatin-like phospholipase family protein [Rhodothermales bacterium]
MSGYDTSRDKTPVSLVLGSGGARGLAHIGVIRALSDDGKWDVQSVTGASIGALIGGLYAAGDLDVYTEWVRGLSRSDVWGLLDFSFTGKGLFEGDRVMKKLKELVGDAQFEDLAIPFTAVATDLERRQEVWLNTGGLFEAIRASVAIPGLFTPAVRNGRILVDGGLLSPLPIGPSLARTTERTIAVSLNGAVDTDDTDQPRAAGSDPGAEQDTNLFRRWAQRAQDMWSDEDDEAHPYDAIDTIARSLEAMQDRIARHQIASYPPDLLIEIPVTACGVLEFHRADEMIELGYTTAKKALDSLTKE